MEMILTPDKKDEILNQFISYLDAKINQKISIPIIFDPYNKREDLPQSEKFRLFTEMMQIEGPVWTDENHPNLKTTEDIISYSENLRKEWDRFDG
jgi:hypothetical protein